MQMPVAMPGCERPPHRRGLAAQQARHLGLAGVRRVVIGVRAIELLLANARILMKQTAATTAREGKGPWHAEGDIAQPRERGDVSAAAKRTRDDLELERRRHRHPHTSRIALRP